MFTDITYIFFWWLVIFLLGGLSLPLIFSIFNDFWDKGYIFSKIVSVGLVTYALLVLGVCRILPFTSLSIFSLVAVGLVLNAIYLCRKARWHDFFGLIRQNWRGFLWEESMFFLLLTGWSWLRGFAPDIEGLEKFMDWGFINSMLRSKFMPPIDIWFGSEPINYYYFGHLLFATLTKLTGMTSAITYNLSVATVCSLTFISSFSFSANLMSFHKKWPVCLIPSQATQVELLASQTNETIRSPHKDTTKHTVFLSLVSALLLTFGGNLHTVYKIATIDIQQNDGNLVLTKEALSKASEAYRFTDATRFIGYDPEVKEDKPIHEFPLYSFVVADLHGHMNDIPVVLLFMSFLLAIYMDREKKQRRGLPDSGLIDWKLSIGSSMILSVAYMTNAWDFAIYGLLFGTSFLFINLHLGNNGKTAISKALVNGLLVILFWYIFTLPFSVNFTSMAKGVSFSDAHSPFYQLFILYGGFWIIAAPFFFYLIATFFSNRIHRQKRLNINVNTADVFVFSIILIATLLVIIPEIGYVKDIYVDAGRRSNTMFKLVYQAFIMYSLVSGYVCYRTLLFIKTVPLRATYKTLFISVLICHGLYPYFAIKSYYGLTNYKGLWGLNFLKSQYPDNFNVANWLNQNVAGQPVILEARGNSFTTDNQISVVTGLPTVLGWFTHEWLWRGGYDLPHARSLDVAKMYQSGDPNELRNIIRKYSIEYVLVGDKEREKYQNINEQIFIDLGAKIVFQSGQTKLYQLASLHQRD